MSDKPVILVATANDRQIQGQYLRALGDEVNGIREALNNCLDRDLVDLEILPNANWESILNTFRKERFRDRIAIFHFAGHAGDYELLLEASANKTEKIQASGLISLLSNTPSLKLVFLNGCSTLAQSEAMREAGIPNVIGTSGSIKDQLALEVALHFYQGLGQGLSIIKSWEITVSAISGRYGLKDYSNYYRAFGTAHSLMQMPWQILFAPGKEAAKEWNIPQSSNDPLFGLPDLDESYGFPIPPYRFLEAYTEKDARIFFGRNTYVRDVFHWFIHQPAPRVLLLHGYSGVGKSSLLSAGVVPRIKSLGTNILHLKRTAGLGIVEALAKATGLPVDASIQEIKNSLNTFSASLIIFDHAEEIILQPPAIKEAEINDLGLLFYQLFHGPDALKNAKLILSFRKEFYAEFTQRLNQGKVAFTSLFVDHFQESDILEIVNGLQSTEQHKSNYQLNIAPDLPSIIAEDLLKDEDGNIAPTLQIILTKLWKEEEGSSSRRFSVDSYRQLSRQGVLLSDFLDQQLEQLYNSTDGSSLSLKENGLILDILYLFTTEYNTSVVKSFSELKNRYANINYDLKSLLNTMLALRLLTTVGEDGYRLVHDSLVSLIRVRWAKSEATSQRALRILNNKTREYGLHQNTHLNEQELTIVESGIAGMRKLNALEQKILANSQQLQAAKRKRNYRIRIFSTAAIGFILLLAIISTVLWRDSHKKATINQLVTKALLLAQYDATAALDTLSHAIAMDPQNISARQARYDIFRTNEFYLFNYKISNAIQAVDLSSYDRSSIAAANDTLYRFDSTAHLVQQIPHPGIINRVMYLPDGKSFISSCDNGNSYLYNAKGMTTSVLKHGDKKLSGLAVSAYPVQVFTGDQSGLVLIWKEDGVFLDTLCLSKNSISCMATSADSAFLAIGHSNGLVEIWDYQRKQRMIQKSLPVQINSLRFTEGSTGLFIGTRSSRALVWYYKTDELMALVGHTRRINEGLYFSKAAVYLTASDDGEIRSWDRTGQQGPVFAGHHGAVYSMAGTEKSDNFYFISGGVDGSIKWWKYRSKISNDFGNFEPSVLKADYFGDKLIIAHNKLLDVEGINDLDFDANQFFDLIDEVKPYPISIIQANTSDRKTLMPPGLVIDFQIVPNRNAAFIIQKDNNLIRLDLESYQFDTITTLSNPVSALCMSASGEKIAIGTETGSISLLDKQGKEIESLNSSSFITGLSFSENTNQLFSINLGGTVERWNLSTFEATTLLTVDERLEAISVSPNGQYIAIGSSGLASRLRLLENKGNKLLWEVDLNAANRVGANGIYQLTFSPGGQVVSVGTLDGRVIIFDLKGLPVQEFDIPGGSQIKSIQFSADEKKILVSNEAGSVFELAIFNF